MTTLLVDGDVVCYNACEDRHRRHAISTTEYPIDPKLLPDIFEKYDYLSYYREEASFTDEENEEYLHKAYSAFKGILAHLKEICYADDVRVAIGGKGNFRDDIFPLYKANRHADESKKNPFVPIIRKMAAEEGLAVEAHGMEADDLLRIWAEECRAEGKDFVVASIDKDLKMIQGTHYLIHKQEFFNADEDFARRFYYEQLLHGDPTDNIGALPGVGPVKAKALLADCITEEDFQSTVLQVYYSTVHQWRYALQLTGQLIYLKKHRDDWFDMSRWPQITLEDIVNKPKKSKKMEWTLDTALAAVNPESITTRERWESALLYLVELRDDLPQEILDAVDVLTERDKVPTPEKEAYRLVSDFLKRNVISKKDEKVDSTFGAPTAKSLPPPLPKPVAAVVGPPPSFALPKVAIPETIVAKKPEALPSTVMHETTSGIHPNITAAKPTLPQQNISSVPSFNPSMFKKK